MSEGGWTREELGLAVWLKGPRPRPIRYRVDEKGCWNCISHCLRAPGGYPTISVSGRDDAISRVVYRALKGSLLEAQVVRHSCDNRQCINPRHLEPGTPLLNSGDMVARDRSCKGDRNGNARLTEEQVLEIKSNRHLPSRELARRYGVQKTAILHIWQGHTWAHVPGNPPHRRPGFARKLTDAQVREIRDCPEVSGREFGRRFGVTSQAVSLIRKGINRRDQGGKL